MRTLVSLAVAIVGAMPLAMPGSAPLEPAPGRLVSQTGVLGPADRDLLVRVRQAGLWERPAGAAARQRGNDDVVKDVGEKIADEHHDLDDLVRQVAAQLGVDLPDVPTAEQQGWLDELATAQGESFDRVFVNRLRAAHGKIFPAIAKVRAGTRNPVIRDFATAVDAYVARHMTYLEGTDLVDYVTLPASLGEASTGTSVEWTISPSGAVGPADRDLLVRMRQTSLWQQDAAQAAQRLGRDQKVRDIGGTLTKEYRALVEIISSVATELGVTLPDQPNAEQRRWLAEITTARGDDIDRVFIERLRAADGDIFPVIAAVRSNTRNELIRGFAAAAHDTVLRHMKYLEDSGLVDYGQLPLPPVPDGIRSAAFNRNGGVSPIVIWLIVSSAGVVAAAALAQWVRSR